MSQWVRRCCLMQCDRVAAKQLSTHVTVGRPKKEEAVPPETVREEEEPFLDFRTVRNEGGIDREDNQPF